MNKGLIQSLAKMVHSDALSEYRLRMETELASDVIFADIYDRTFSEMIVRECVGVIESGRFLHDQAPTAIFAKECSGAVKRHFGVE
jgi:hypothetical protein